MSKTNKKVKTIKLPTFHWKWNSRKGEKFFEKPTLDSTEISINGKIVTLLILSFVSGIIDLVFFSELSKAIFKIATTSIPAGIVYTLMSIGFTSAKFWCAMQLSVIKELQARLLDNGFTWANKLNKPKLRWNIAHKYLVVISLITSISLSIVSIGDAVRKNQNEILKAKSAYEKIAKYSSAADVSDEEQFKALVKGTNASSGAADKAATQAANIWPIIEDYRAERAEFEAEFGNNFGSKEEVVFRGQTIIPDEYWDKQNSLVVNKVKAEGRTLSINQIRNITSEAVLAKQIKNEIEASVANTSLDSLTALADKTNDKAKQEIINLQGRFVWPDGTPVEFDENNVSKSLQTLGDIQSAYENDSGDVGQSAKMFMIVGPALESKFSNKSTLENITDKKVSTNSFGTTEVMMMILIMIFGIVQEFIIALYTPKSTIDRRTLSQFSAYLNLKEMNVNDFLRQVYENYLDDGSYDQAKYDYKMEKLIDLVAKRQAKCIDREIENRTQFYIEQYSKGADKKSAPRKLKEKEIVETQDISKAVPLPANVNMEELTKEVPLDKPRWEEMNKEIADTQEKPVEESKPKVYSEKVDNAVKEIEDLLKEDKNV